MQLAFSHLVLLALVIVAKAECACSSRWSSTRGALRRHGRSAVKVTLSVRTDSHLQMCTHRDIYVSSASECHGSKEKLKLSQDFRPAYWTDAPWLWHALATDGNRNRKRPSIVTCTCAASPTNVVIERGHASLHLKNTGLQAPRLRQWQNAPST